MKKAQFLSHLISGLLWLPIAAQKHQDTILLSFNHRITSFSTDTQQNIFIGFANGSIKRVSCEGEVLDNYSFPNQSPITFIEAQNNRKLFAFQRDLQQIKVLDRFSSLPVTYKLSDYGLDFVQHTCPSVDGSFWTLENNPSRLKKINPLNNQILLDIQPELSDSIHLLRTYQNLLYALAPSSIQAFDQFGSLIRTANLPDAAFIQIWKNRLIVSHQGGYQSLHPITFEESENKTSNSSGHQTILLLGDLTAFIHYNEIILISNSL